MNTKTITNRKWMTACAAALFMATAVAAQDNSVTVTDRPLIATSSNYTNFRAPLRQAPLLKLPVGQVQRADGCASISSCRKKDSTAS